MFKELNKLKCFFDQPYKEFSVREFARITKSSPATASSYLESFTKEKIF
jgi:Fic family protein